VLNLAPLRWLGAISYGIYVYQMACMAAVHRLLSSRSYESASAKAEFFCASLAVTIVVAACSYFIVERPLSQWADRARDRDLRQPIAAVQPQVSPLG
jgi:peptidoglycan/LPS O-acetylase OafA/YrhL